MRLPRSERGKRLAIVAVVLGVAAAYFLFSRVIPHDDLQQLLDDVADTLGAWTYLLVGALAFLETGAFVGLVVPGETVMLLGGAVAGQGAIDIYLLIAIAWFAAWAGDTTSFFVGRRLGRGFVLRHGPRFGIGQERFERVESYFGRHGGKTVLIGRFVGLVRALAPFIAGSSHMRYRAFVPYCILGTGLWASAHILIGYFFSRSIDTAARYAGRGVFLLGTLIVVTVAIVVAVRFLRVPENRVRAVRWMEGHRATGWLLVLGRWVQPQARFVWARLTPGGSFGLEFTTVLAVLSVSLFALVSYTVIVSGDPGPTRADITAQDIAESIRTGWLTEIAEVVTKLGAGAVVTSLAAVCAAALALRRRWIEFWVLVVGMAITIVAGIELKAEVDRPRPGGGLVEVDGSGFPSAHAAYSMLYVWIAATVVIRLRAKVVYGTPIVLAGIAVAGLVGLSRVYLGVHYLSDVSAGWALGATSFSLCAAVALAVSQLRQNPAGARGGGKRDHG